MNYCFPESSYARGTFLDAGIPVALILLQATNLPKDVINTCFLLTYLSKYMFFYFFAGIQMSPAKVEQRITGMVRQKGYGEFAGEVGCDPKKLVGARKRR